MSALLKRNDTYYFRLRIPKDIQKYFPRPEIVKSTHTTKYTQAKGLVRKLLGKTEELFTMLRSGVLTDDEINRLVEKYKREQLAKGEEIFDIVQGRAGENIKDLRAILGEHYAEALDTKKDILLNARGMEQLTVHTAHSLLQERGQEGVNIASYTPEFKNLCRAVALANKEVYTTLIERNETGDSEYDRQERAKPKSNLLSEAIAAYSRANGKGHRGKLDEKMLKIMESFRFVSGKEDLLLSEITYDMTVKVGHRLAKYPLYRGTRYPGKTLQEIDGIVPAVKVTGEATLKEELGVLAGVYDFAIRTQEGLLKNFANGLGKVIVGKQPKKKASSAKDIFRAADIQEIVKGLEYFKSKGTFTQNPHLRYITLIGLYSGARINEICQLNVDDIEMVDGIPCFNHKEEESSTKSLKNRNSIRINPVHPMLIVCGLLAFRDFQKAKGYTGLWEGSKNHSCDFYAPQANCSHYVGKWWNGTFKAKLTLSNTEKQTFHSTRHTFINWFKQNVRPLDYEARNALSGHLDKDDVAAMERQGYDSDSEGEVTYTKDLNVKRQMELLTMLDYGIDLQPLYNLK